MLKKNIFIKFQVLINNPNEKEIKNGNIMKYNGISTMHKI